MYGLRQVKKLHSGGQKTINLLVYREECIVNKDNTVTWPNQYTSPVMISFNFVAEDFWLALDPDNIGRPKTLSMGQYGAKRGLKRILDVLDCFKIKATFFVPGLTAERYPEHIKEILSHGHEIGTHGYEYKNFALLDEREQKESLVKGIKAIEKVCGVTPVGFRAPLGDITPATQPLLEELGFKYSSTTRRDDIPTMVGKDENVVELHSHWELIDIHYFGFNYHPPFPDGNSRISNYNDVLSIWEDEFDAYYRYGLNYQIIFHPQIIGNPGRIKLLEKLLTHIVNKGNVWFCTGTEIADYWIEYTSKIE